MQAAAAANLHVTGTLRRRFFNTLRLSGPVYTKCLLPVLRKEAMVYSPNVVESTAWTQTRRVTYGYHHESFRPPPGLANALGAAPHWAGPFAQFAIPLRPAPPPPASDAPPAKKPRPFQRAVPVAGHLRTIAARLWPTPPQRKALLCAFAMARNAYNFATAAMLAEGYHSDYRELCQRWAAQPLPPWASRKEDRVSTMFQTRAIQDRVNSVKSNVAKRKKDPTLGPYELHFRSARKTPSEVLHIEKDYPGAKQSTLEIIPAPDARAPSTKGWPAAPRRGFAECMITLGNNLKRLGGILVQDHADKIARMLAERDHHLKEEARLRWDKRLNAFYLLYTYELPRLPEPDPTFQTKGVVACDPGCYPFQAWYAPRTGEHGALLVGGTDELMRRCYDIDRRCGHLGRLKPGGTRTSAQYRNRKRRMKRALKRQRARLEGWVKAAHYDAANSLLERFDVILQPRLNVQELTLTATRNISARTARAMLTWSHSQYIARLKSASVRYAGRHIIETFEPGTSRTCTHCGAWKEALQPRDKVYACGSCGLRFDRQMAGARNNFFAAYGAAVRIGWDGVEIHA